MVPRIFISSTYYDLKHVRERLEKFVESYGFEPILFESDKVTYQHGKAVDQSAYYEVGLCHVMVLIIGGRYGSPSTQTKVEEERKRYDEEYISITRKEFETAAHKNIPVLVFIDKNVNSDYETYKENQDFFDESATHSKDKNVKRFKFAHVDHVNVFKFIDIVKSKPVKTFDKVEEIEIYLKAQFAGMFYLYLESLKKGADDKKILDTISELNNVTLRMNEMLTSVGKQILGKDKGEYEKVIDTQLTIMLDFYAQRFDTSIEFENELDYNDLQRTDIKKVAQLIYDNALNVKVPSPLGSSDYWKKYKEINNDIVNKTQEQIQKINSNILIKDFNFRQLNSDLKTKVLPFIKTKSDTDQLIRRMADVIGAKLGELPF